MTGPKEVSLLYANHFTAYPGYSASFADLMKVLLSRGEIYSPEMIELGQQDNFKRIPFEPNDIDELSHKWNKQQNSPGWTFVRNKPVRVIVKLSKYLLDFESVSIHVQSDYFRTLKNVDEFISINNEFYSILHSAYGFIRVPEMVKTHSGPLGNMRLGIDLKRAVPDIYWGNFFGPEYVEMFGPEKVYSSPINSIRRLDDGGVLLLLSSSPLDYLNDPIELDKRREILKKYFGEEAFDIGDPTSHGKIPKFRYLNETGRKGARQIVKSRDPGDWLSRADRGEWNNWIVNNESLALDFVTEIEATTGFSLNFEMKDFERLDSSIDQMRSDKREFTIDFLKKMAAFVSQVVIRQLGARWSFNESNDIPILVLGDIKISSLARAQKVVVDDEKFEPWYRFLADELVPAMKSANPKRSKA